jgi:hypothetical protein
MALIFQKKKTKREKRIVQIFDCLCDVPGHWGRNLIRDPPCAAELPEFFEDFEQSFLDGQPFEFAEVAYEMFAS